MAPIISPSTTIGSPPELVKKPNCTNCRGSPLGKDALFGKALARARERVLVDLGKDGMPLERACAAAVRLIDLGYFRIGNDVYAADNGSFGLTTLERRHVRVRRRSWGPRGFRTRKGIRRCDSNRI